MLKPAFLVAGILMIASLSYGRVAGRLPFGDADQTAQVAKAAQTDRIASLGSVQQFPRLGDCKAVRDSVCLSDRADGQVAAHAATLIALAQMPSRLRMVVREGNLVSGDMPPLAYVATFLPCSLGRGGGDGGSQIATSDGKCWHAVIPPTGADVRWWGARCDGVTNDSVAIQAAVDASGRNGSYPVLIPWSNRGCVAAITINAANNVPLKGSGWTTLASGGSKLRAPDLASSALSIGEVSGVSVSDILFLGALTSASSYTASVPPLIAIGAAKAAPNNITLSNVGAMYAYDAVKMTNAAMVRWNNGQIRNFTHTAMTIDGDPAVVTGGGNDLYLSRFIIDQDDASWQDVGTLTAGLYIPQNGGSVTLDGWDVVHAHVGLLLAPPSGKYVIWLFGSNLYFDTCDYTGTKVPAAVTKTATGAGAAATNTYTPDAAGIRVSPEGNGRVYGLVLNNLWTSTCTHGIALQGVDAGAIDTVKISNLLALNNGKAGLYAAQARNLLLVNVTSAGNGQMRAQGALSAAGFPGLEFDAGATDIAVTNGRSGSPVQGYGDTQGYGIQFDLGFTGIARVNGINLTGNRAGALHLATPKTGGISVLASPGYNPVGAAAAAVGASPWTYTAGVSDETLYLHGGTVSAARVGGVALCTASPCAVHLAPGQSVQVDYSSRPTAAVNRE